MLKNNRFTYKYKTVIAVFAAITMSLFAASCSNDEPLYPSEAIDDISFTTSAIIGGTSSRVSYEQEADAKMKVRWEQNDTIYLVDKKNEDIKLAEFVIQNPPNDKATFTCTKVFEGANLSNATGVFKYMPVGDGYTQKENGSNAYDKVTNYGKKGTQHLKYANVIESQEISEVDFINKKNCPTLEFNNTTAIFRVIVKPKTALAKGSSITMYGVEGWGVGVSLTLDFTVESGETLVAYLAAPSGQARGSLSVALTDGIYTDDNKITRNIIKTYKGISNKDYIAGSEYTADFSTNAETDSWESEINGDNEFVNLGLSVLWSTKNLGAQTLTGENSFGNYYTWGSVNPYQVDMPSQEKDKNPLGQNLDDLLTNKIITSFTESNGSTSYKLTANFDAATCYFDNLNAEGKIPEGDKNSPWFTPTRAQFEELLSQCTWVWNAALNGYEVVASDNDNKEGQRVTLFMPAAGFKENGNTHNIGHYAYYWTSTPPVDNSSDTQNAWCMHISGAHRSNSQYISEDLYPRYRAMSIRPVKVKTEGGQSTPVETKTDQTTNNN